MYIIIYLSIRWHSIFDPRRSCWITAAANSTTCRANCSSCVRASQARRAVRCGSLARRRRRRRPGRKGLGLGEVLGHFAGERRKIIGKPMGKWRFTLENGHMFMSFP